MHFLCPSSGALTAVEWRERQLLGLNILFSIPFSKHPQYVYCLWVREKFHNLISNK
jgi:hypothetical protein